MTAIKRLWITEKPEMARSLAAGLALTFNTSVVNQSTAKNDGCLRMSNGDAVGHFFGHMLEMEDPGAYLTEEQERGDVFSYLPLLPPSFMKRPKPDMGQPRGGKPSHQFYRMCELAREAQEIVNAGDTDREGQLIVDEFLMYVDIDPRGSTKPVWRLALQNPKAEEICKLVRAGLENNSDEKWARRYAAASVREKGDWAIGMTGSRAYRQVSGFQKMAVGRVQTPTLALVVKRELEIERFQSVQYFVPVITLVDGTRMRWFRREGAAGMPGFDTEGRIINEAVARQIVSAIMGRNRGEISLALANKMVEPPPLPYDLGTLQSTAAKRFGLTLKEVTEAAQKLYEKHKMITYIGTDCRFLPTSLLEESQRTMQALGKLFPRQVGGVNMALRSKCWNDAKTDEHFGIAPTGTIAPGLTLNERSVFSAVAKRFIAQFHPNHEYARLNLQAKWSADEFKAVERQVTVNGWKDAEFDPEDQDRDSPEAIEQREAEAQSQVQYQAEGQ